MSLLVILTLIYVAILVLALAVSLIAIWVYLLRISHRMREIRTALFTVQTLTEPLPGPLGLLQKVVGETADNLAELGKNMAQAGRSISELVGPSRS